MNSANCTICIQVVFFRIIHFFVRNLSQESNEVIKLKQLVSAKNCVRHEFALASRLSFTYSKSQCRACLI